TNVFSHNFFLPDWVFFYVPLRTQWIVDHVLYNQIFTSLFYFVPLILLLALVARGRLDRAVSALRFVFRSRGRFLFAAAISLGIYYTWLGFQILHFYAGNMPSGPEALPLSLVILRGFASAISSAMLVGLSA